MDQQVAAAGHEESLRRPGNPAIFVRSWRPAGSSAVVVICHGVNSQGGQYVWVAGQLAAHGFAVYSLDLRGRGRSEGSRYYVERVDDYVSDLAAVVDLAKSRNPGLPVFVLGHSAGGVVSCSYCLDHQKEIAGLVCESFAFEVPAPNLVLSIIKGLSRFAPRLGVLRLKNEDFTRDPKALQALNADPLILERGSAGDDGRGTRPRRRAPAPRIPAHHASRLHSSRHRRPGDDAERQPVFLRHGGVEG